MVVCEAGGGRIHSGPMWIDCVVAICNIWSTIGEIVIVMIKAEDFEFKSRTNICLALWRLPYHARR
jgi:hypothetical protein